jgi:hypothetical protein
MGGVGSDLSEDLFNAPGQSTPVPEEGLSEESLSRHCRTYSPKLTYAGQLLCTPSIDLAPTPKGDRLGSVRQLEGKYGAGASGLRSVSARRARLEGRPRQALRWGNNSTG